MPAGYIVAITHEITDQAKFAEYGQSTGPAIAKFGGKMRVRRGRTEVVEGEMKGGIALLEFPSYENALAFYKSPEYQEAKKKREGVAKMTFIVTEAVPE
jgi:uncharacterized protein (DUF1330 family)